jgi:thiol peroxidase
MPAEPTQLEPARKGTISMQTTDERAGAVTMHGNPLTLVGPELKPGDAAPEFTLTTSELKPLTLDDATEHGTKKALLIVVPSLDTGTCSLETKTFHKRLSELPSDVNAYIVSLDLPFAQTRWAKENDAPNLKYASDYQSHAFGNAYGVRIKELGVLARANFVIGTDKKIAYAGIVTEVSDEPPYDEIFAATKA